MKKYLVIEIVNSLTASVVPAETLDEAIEIAHSFFDTLGGYERGDARLLWEYGAEEGFSVCVFSTESNSIAYQE